MHLDRTRAMALGLLAAALVTVGLMVGRGRSPISSAGARGLPAGTPACVTAVVEHSACVLPPRGTGEQHTPLPSSSPR